ncbi:hypothetical protein [Microcella sp.]|uniref:hypothetical protein n=1 Tax=Microcella sp. TaxID=1913979 RepID=UPI00299F6804|nr:hypothetical protein [Microcella sp.]MDX2026270.1 hypothetical protein [Microcella sp.]
MTVREALGGPWAAHWLFLVGLLPPTTLLVLLQESTTPYPEWWWPLVSATVQHVVAGATIVLGGAIARRRHDIIPLPTVFAIWAIAAFARGYAAGVIAERVAGVDPQFATRIAIWLLASVVWLPAMVYAVAQFERRRALLGAIAVAEDAVHSEQPHTDETRALVQQQLRHAVADSLAPALNDLQASLEATRDSLDRASVAELSLRLSRLHDHTADLLESADGVAATTPVIRAGLRQALDVPPRLPWLSAALVTGSTVVLVLFDVWRIFGPLAAVELMVATIAAGLVLGLVPTIVGAVRPSLLTQHGQRINAVALVLSIAVSGYLMLNSGIDPITWHGMLVVPLLAVSLTIASAMYYSAIVMADANAEAHARLSVLQADLAELRATNDHIVARERQRLSDLMHGPVQGRIAACIMALNFHSHADTTVDQARELATAVLDHVRAIARDLDDIAAADPRSPDPVDR